MTVLLRRLFLESVSHRQPLLPLPFSRRLHLAPPFLVGDDYEPVALKTKREGNIEARVAEARLELESCRACPRDCKVNRMEGKKGACNTGRHET